LCVGEVKIEVRGVTFHCLLFFLYLFLPYCAGTRGSKWNCVSPILPWIFSTIALQHFLGENRLKLYNYYNNGILHFHCFIIKCEKILFARIFHFVNPFRYIFLYPSNCKQILKLLGLDSFQRSCFGIVCCWACSWIHPHYVAWH